MTKGDFLATDRSGLAFQRNVGFVTIQGNYFRNAELTSKAPRVLHKLDSSPHQSRITC
jgi:hypothetical protein